MALAMNVDAAILLELARKGGADFAEVYQTAGTSRSVSFEANRLKQVETGDDQGTALRVWVNGRPGLAVAEGPFEAQALVERALALSAFGVAEVPDLPTAGFPLTPPPLHTASLDDLVACGEQAIALVRERYPQVLCSGGYSLSLETVRLVNSLGLDLSTTGSSLEGSLGAEWVRGDDLLQVYEGEEVLDEPDPRALAARVLARLGWAERAAVSPGGTLPVLFTAKAASVLLGAALAALNGRQVLQQASPWSGRRGEAVLSPLLTLSQDPTRRPYDTPFDDEGTQTTALDFVRNGVLHTFFADRRTARKLDLPPAGNGFRDELGVYPQPGLFNLLVSPGDRSFAALVESIDEGIVVDQVLGSGAGISGEFSVNVDLGYRVRRGEIVGRLKDTMVAGNAYTALNRLVALGCERFWEGSLLVGDLLVEALSVTTREE